MIGKYNLRIWQFFTFRSFYHKLLTFNLYDLPQMKTKSPCCPWMNPWQIILTRKLVNLWVITDVIICCISFSCSFTFPCAASFCSQLHIWDLAFFYFIFICFCLGILDGWFLYCWFPGAIKWGFNYPLGRWCQHDSPYVKGLLRIFFPNMSIHFIIARWCYFFSN